jgi:hypothetical protein
MQADNVYSFIKHKIHPQTPGTPILFGACETDTDDDENKTKAKLINQGLKLNASGITKEICQDIISGIPLTGCIIH